MSKASAATGKASDIAQRIVATMERKGYYVAKGEGQINIAHVEGNLLLSAD